MQLSKIPILYLSANHAECNSDQNWSHQWPSSRDLPDTSPWIENIPGLDSKNKIAVLIEDDLLRPFRIQLEKKIPRRDLDRYLAWKAKRLLPYPVDQAILQYDALADPLSFLLFTLPRPWVNAICQAFARRGIQCGYISGVFHSLSTVSSLRAGHSLWLFSDFYVFATLDAKGKLQHYRLRKLPLDEHGHLDIQTLVHSDLPKLLEPESPLNLIGMYQAWDRFLNDFRVHFSELGLTVRCSGFSGSRLTRVEQLLLGRPA